MRAIQTGGILKRNRGNTYIIRIRISIRIRIRPITWSSFEYSLKVDTKVKVNDAETGAAASESIVPTAASESIVPAAATESTLDRDAAVPVDY